MLDCEAGHLLETCSGMHPENSDLSVRDHKCASENVEAAGRERGSLCPPCALPLVDLTLTARMSSRHWKHMSH